jgi:thiol-disulfide isomerase/thioredoxin
MRLYLAGFFAASLLSASLAVAQTTPAPALIPRQATPAGASREPVGTYWGDPKFMAAWSEGLQLKRQYRYEFAIDAFKKADKLSGDGCLKCLNQIYSLEAAMGRWKDAIATTQRIEAVAVTPYEKAMARANRGIALMRQAGDKPKQDSLAAAHAELQASLAIQPTNTANYFDGCVLARMGKDDEASKAFATCAANAPDSDPMKVRAQHFAENPKLALAKMAPAFQVTTLDGSHFNLDDMGGRVVLIDFWATWCGPCNEELPHLQKIAKEFAGQPLVILSISWDNDEAKWKDFIAKHQMTWQQYRDADHKLSQRFDVNAIPHYFTIDADGVLTAEMMGSGSDVEGKLKRLLKRASARPAPTQVATEGAAGNR